MPAYYSASVESFLLASVDHILGALADAYNKAGFAGLISDQIEAWRTQVQILRSAIPSDLTQSSILLEFPIPRRQRRIDVVLLLRDLIVPIEFKTGISPDVFAAS